MDLQLSNADSWRSPNNGIQNRRQWTLSCALERTVPASVPVWCSRQLLAVSPGNVYLDDYKWFSAIVPSYTGMLAAALLPACMDQSTLDLPREMIVGLFCRLLLSWRREACMSCAFDLGIFRGHGALRPCERHVFRKGPYSIVRAREQRVPGPHGEIRANACVRLLFDKVC